MLGVPGLMDVYRAGRVALANAPGTGIADDKVVYAYVPQIIKYYLGEDAIIPNVPTYVCWDDTQRQHVLANLDKLVVKPANESGGYGMLIGPRATRPSEHAVRATRSRPTRATTSPSRRSACRACRCSTDDGLEGRHVDLRPFIVYGNEMLRAARRADARRAQEGFAGRQLVARRRQQRYLGGVVKERGAGSEERGVRILTPRSLLRVLYELC